MKSVKVFGDSILKRVVYEQKEQRYVVLPKEPLTRFAAQQKLHVDVQALFGCTITKGMQLLQRFVGKQNYSDYVLLEFGGNDCDYRWAEVAAEPTKEHKSQTELPLFKQTLKKMITLLRTAHMEPILMSLPPIDSQRYLDHICRSGLNKEAIVTWLGDVQAIARRQELYSLAVIHTATEYSCRLIDVRSGFLQHKAFSSLLCEDGIHPNEKGHELILSLIASWRQGA